MGIFLQCCERKQILAQKTFPHGNATYQLGMARVTSAEKKLGTYVDLEKCNGSEVSLVFLTADM